MLDLMLDPRFVFSKVKIIRPSFLQLSNKLAQTIDYSPKIINPRWSCVWKVTMNVLEAKQRKLLAKVLDPQRETGVVNLPFHIDQRCVL